MDANAAKAEQELTDGFHLVIDALKLNGVKTIYGVPGIPITDFGRMAQAEGIRVISFRHEQHAGNAAAIAGFLTKKPGICLTVSAPGFLNGLTALANATTNCFPMILISGSSEREIVDLQQGDYEEMDQLAIAKPLCKAAFRVLHAADIGIGLARAIRARGRYELYDWRIETSGDAGELALRIWAEPSDFVALRYDNPPGGAKICLNSKIARCELTLRRGGQTVSLRSSRAAFEILDDHAPPGVTPAA